MSTTLDEKPHQETLRKCWQKTPENIQRNKICKQICEEKTTLRKNLSFSLTLSWRRSLSYKNQSSKSMDWFLYDRDIYHERVITKERDIFTTLQGTYGETFFAKMFKKG